MKAARWRFGRAGKRGSAAVELAVSLPFLVTMFLGVWQYGYSYYIYNELEQAVRSGARYASLKTYDSGTSTPSSAFLTAVQNMVVYGDPAPTAGAQPVVPGLTPGQVSVTPVMTLGVPTAMVVGISSYTMPAVFSNITFTGKPSTEFRFVGLFSPP